MLEYFEQYLDRVFPRFLSEKPWNYKDDLCMVGAEDLYCATGSEVGGSRCAGTLPS